MTYHIQECGDLQSWSDIATYAGSNIVLNTGITEVSRIGSPDENVTVRDTYCGRPGTLLCESP